MPWFRGSEGLMLSGGMPGSPGQGAWPTLDYSIDNAEEF